MFLAYGPEYERRYIAIDVIEYVAACRRKNGEGGYVNIRLKTGSCVSWETEDTTLFESVRAEVVAFMDGLSNGPQPSGA